jgi:hypothetical protein
METKIKPPKKIFEVIIFDKVYDVYDIEGKEEDPGNNEPKTWWVYYADRLPEGTVPPVDSDNWEHWHASIQRHLWDIRFVQKNTSKGKWNSTHFRNHTSVEMWCNKKLIYAFTTTGTSSGLSFAMAKVQYLQTMLSEHCFNFFEPEKENGRKIWWYNLPATVVTRSRGWEIMIKPDYTDMPKEEWWKEYKKRSFRPSDDEPEWDRHEEGEESDMINWGDALSDDHINWFRKH